jgi:hypothetical protein
MSNVNHLRMRAQSCLRLFDPSQDPNMKDGLFSMAQTYLVTAIGLRSSEAAVSNEDGVGESRFRAQGRSPAATEEIAMQQQADRVDTTTAPTHPRCPNCAVPMWLVFINSSGPEEPHHFECKACDARTTIGSMAEDQDKLPSKGDRYRKRAEALGVSAKRRSGATRAAMEKKIRALHEMAVTEDWLEGKGVSVAEQHPKRLRNPSHRGLFIVDTAPREIDDRPPAPEEKRNIPAAVALGRKSGAARGRA